MSQFGNPFTYGGPAMFNTVEAEREARKRKLQQSVPQPVNRSPKSLARQAAQRRELDAQELLATATRSPERMQFTLPAKAPADIQQSQGLPTPPLTPSIPNVATAQAQNAAAQETNAQMVARNAAMQDALPFARRMNDSDAAAIEDVRLRMGAPGTSPTERVTAYQAGRGQAEVPPPEMAADALAAAQAARAARIRTLPDMTNESLGGAAERSQFADDPEKLRQHRLDLIQSGLDRNQIPQTAEERVAERRAQVELDRQRRSDLLRESLLGRGQDRGAEGRIREQQKRRAALTRQGGDVDAAQFELTGERVESDVDPRVEVQRLKGEQNRETQQAIGSRQESRQSFEEKMNAIERDQRLSDQDKQFERDKLVRDEITQREMELERLRQMAPKVLGRGEKLVTPELQPVTPQTLAQTTVWSPPADFTQEVDLEGNAVFISPDGVVYDANGKALGNL